MQCYTCSKERKVMELIQNYCGKSVCYICDRTIYAEMKDKERFMGYEQSQKYNPHDEQRRIVYRMHATQEGDERC